LWTESQSQIQFLLKEVGAKLAQSLWTVPDDSRARERFFFYREIDLEQLINEIRSLNNYLFKFQQYLLDPIGNASEYRQLCSEPPIAREILRLKGAQKNP
jgi:hypothetical protein